MADSTNTTPSTPVAEKPQQKRGFWKSVKSEFKKITWPDKVSVWKQSGAVIAITVVLGLLISLIDTALKYGFNFFAGL